MTGRNFSKIALIVTTLLGAFASTVHAYSKLRPTSGYAIAALADAKAKLYHVDRLLANGLGNFSTEDLALAARQSLVTEALNPKALRLLAIHARSNENGFNVERYIDLSQKLSRRDATTQILQIQNLAKLPTTRAGDILKHYDIAMRVNPELKQRFFPALVKISKLPEARKEIQYHVKSGTEWIPDVFRLALKEDGGAQNIAEILLDSFPNGHIKIPTGLETGALFSKLFSEKKYPLMKKLYLSISKKDQTLISSTEFSESSEYNYGPISWVMVNNSDISTSFVKEADGNNSALISVLGGFSGSPLQKVIFLEPGRYRLNHKYLAPASAEATIFWSLVCLDTPSPVIEAFIMQNMVKQRSNIDAKVQRNSIEFSLQCSAQLLSLNVSDTSPNTNIDISLGSISIKSI